LRRIALNLIRFNTSIKTSIKSKRLPAATSDEFRAPLLGGRFDYHSLDEHAVISKVFFLENMATLFTAAVEARKRLDS